MGASPTAAIIDRHFRLAQSVPQARQGLRKPNSQDTGVLLRMPLELKELEHVRIEKVEQLFLDNSLAARPTPVAIL